MRIYKGKTGKLHKIKQTKRRLLKATSVFFWRRVRDSTDFAGKILSFGDRNSENFGTRLTLLAKNVPQGRFLRSDPLGFESRKMKNGDCQKQPPFFWRRVRDSTDFAGKILSFGDRNSENFGTRLTLLAKNVPQGRFLRSDPLGFESRKMKNGDCQKQPPFFWRRVRDSNPRFLVGTQHFECDALRPLFGNFLSEAVRYVSAKTRTATGFFGGHIQKIALFRRFSKMGSNHEKLRFWAELGADRAEQRQNGNTRTAHRQFCNFEVYCK